MFSFFLGAHYVTGEETLQVLQEEFDKGPLQSDNSKTEKVIISTCNQGSEYKQDG
jgi:hypothetical protein